MGKSKTRILRKGIYDQITTMSRQDAIEKATNFLNDNNITEAHDLITMFGLDAEELLEAGASYEHIKALKGLFK